MKVAIVINTAWNIYNFRRGLIRKFIERGWQVTAIAPEDKWKNKLEEMGCNFIPVNIRGKSTNPVSDLILKNRFKRIFKKADPDVLLLYTIKPNIFGSMAAAELGIPFINNISGLGTAFLTSGVLSRIARLLYRRALKHTFRTFFQNQYDLTFFLQHNLVAKRRTGLLPGSGIDLSFFRYQKKEAGGPVTFLLIARLLREKGVEEYLHASRNIVQDGRFNVRFQIIGNPAKDHPRTIDRTLLDTCVKRNIVEYIGEQDDVRPFIREADCIVLPSYREGVARSLLEGAAMGKPLIATDVPGCREVVQENINGYLCEPKDVRSLTDALRRFCALTETKRSTMGRESRRIAEEHFDEAIVINEYVKNISQLDS